MDRISSKGTVSPVFATTNVSLGGAYFTICRAVASTYAALAAAAHRSEPVVLAVRPDFSSLLPYEDWVVRAFEDAPVERDEIRDPRLRAFFDDLFKGYIAETSLSDHYKARYEELNAAHGITWKDSLQWTGRFRQSCLLSPSQVIAAEVV